jgi:chemotaxis protein MotB
MRLPPFQRLIPALLLLAMSGCVSTGTFDQKASEAESLAKEVTRLRQEQAERARTENDRETHRAELGAQVTALTEQNRRCEADRKGVEELLKAKDDTLSTSIFDLRQKIAELSGSNVTLKQDIDNLLKTKSEDVRKSSSTYEELLGIMKDEIARGEATVAELQGTLTVTLFEPLLFDSGRTALKQTAGTTLRKLSSYLKGLKGKSFRVEGYTETVLSASWSLQQYPSGWELAAARAVAVTRLLQSEGVSPLALSAVSYGEYRPQSDNISELGRARNRRIQLVVIPKE